MKKSRFFSIAQLIIFVMVIILETGEGLKRESHITVTSRESIME
jgi:hypothetical protein